MGLEYSVFCVPPLPKQNLQSCDSVENESEYFWIVFEKSLNSPWNKKKVRRLYEPCVYFDSRWKQHFD